MISARVWPFGYCDRTDSLCGSGLSGNLFSTECHTPS
nr:MAG TPA: hypothetical protein [Caudoviricetes sp.]